MSAESVIGSLEWTVSELNYALNNANAAYVTLADDNPLGGRAVWDLMEEIGGARNRARELLALARGDEA